MTCPRFSDFIYKDKCYDITDESDKLPHPIERFNIEYDRLAWTSSPGLNCIAAYGMKDDRFILLSVFVRPLVQSYKPNILDVEPEADYFNDNDKQVFDGWLYKLDYHINWTGELLIVRYKPKERKIIKLENGLFKGEEDYTPQNMHGLLDYGCYDWYGMNGFKRLEEEGFPCKIEK